MRCISSFIFCSVKQSITEIIIWKGKQNVPCGTELVSPKNMIILILIFVQ